MIMLDFQGDPANVRSSIVIDNVGGAAESWKPDWNSWSATNIHFRNLVIAAGDEVETRCQWRPFHNPHWHLNDSNVNSKLLGTGTTIYRGNNISSSNELRVDVMRLWDIYSSQATVTTESDGLNLFLYLPRGLTFPPTPSFEEQILRVAGLCTSTVTRQGSVRYQMELYGEGTATLPRINNFYVNGDRTVQFGTLPLGGNAVREMKLTVNSDLPFIGSIRYTADEPAGTAAKIGGANMRVWAAAQGGYLDLSGGTAYPIQGRGGWIPANEYSHRVYIDTVQGGQLGSHRTNLRLDVVVN